MDGAYLRVALDHPLATLFDYRCDVQPAPRPGTLVQVPFGKRQAVGLVCEVTTHTDVPPSRLRAIDAVCTELPPLGSDWLAGRIRGRLLSARARRSRAARVAAGAARRAALGPAGAGAALSADRRRPRGAPMRCPHEAPRCGGSPRHSRTPLR
jgi:hypothetical protein